MIGVARCNNVPTSTVGIGVTGFWCMLSVTSLIAGTLALDEAALLAMYCAYVAMPNRGAMVGGDHSAEPGAQKTHCCPTWLVLLSGPIPAFGCGTAWRAAMLLMLAPGQPLHFEPENLIGIT